MPKTKPQTLAEWLEASGLTQAELAARVGVQQPVISRLVRGQRMPSAKLAVRLARVTGLPLESLLSEVAA